MSLVADYSSCSDDDNLSEAESRRVQSQCSSTSKKLPCATLLLSGQKLEGLEPGVFMNPYKKKEDESLAILEHHVKMVNTNEKMEKNGRKICWNYRKGRCRFGSNCSYYHDSDLITDTNKQNIPSEDNKIQNTKYNFSSRTEEKIKCVKKRCGLGDTIVPSKKIMNAFNSRK